MTKQDEFNVVAKYLGSFASLRSFARDKELTFLEKAQENLLQVIAEKKEAIELEKMELEELEKNRQAILKELEEKGWSVEALLNPVTKGKGRKMRKAKNKYAYLDEQGETQYWTGRGRMPTALKMQIDAGKILESFLI